MYPVVLTPFIAKTLISPCCAPGNLCHKIIACHAQSYFWAVYALLFPYNVIFISELCVSIQFLWGFIVYFEVGGAMCPHVLPLGVVKCQSHINFKIFFHMHEEYCCDFERNHIESVVCIE